MLPSITDFIRIYCIRFEIEEVGKSNQPNFILCLVKRKTFHRRGGELHRVLSN
jgi:hypothetical protein